MCPFSPPPDPLYVPWPWEAPWNWLAFVAVVAFVSWGLFIRRPRQWFVRSNMAFLSSRRILAHIATSISLAVLFIILLLVFPSMARNDAWFNSEFARLSHHGCDLNRLFSLDSQNRSITSLWLGAAIGLNFVVPVILWRANQHARVSAPSELAG